MAISKAAVAIILLAANLIQPNHDFDYQFGTWNVYVKRLIQTPGGAPRWVDYSGTHVVTPLWNGRANIGVLEISGPSGSIEGMQLRLYNPATKRWSLSFASSNDGQLQRPSTGYFHNGIGEFRNTETIDGKSVIVRSESRVITATSYRDVISRSYDGGKTWTPVWTAVYDKRAR